MHDDHSLAQQLDGEAYKLVGNGNSRWFQQAVRGCAVGNGLRDDRGLTDVSLHETPRGAAVDCGQVP